MDIHLQDIGRLPRSGTREAKTFGITCAGSLLLHTALAALFVLVADQARRVPVEVPIFVDLPSIEVPPSTPRAARKQALPERHAPAERKPAAFPREVPVERRAEKHFLRPPATAPAAAAAGGPAASGGIVVPEPAANASSMMKIPAGPPALPTANRDVQKTEVAAPPRHEPASRADPPAVDAGPAKRAYQNVLRRLIDQQKEYPVFARRAGLEGTCTVLCRLARDGRVVGIAVKKTSGHDILDRASLNAVRKVGTFPPPPSHGEPVQSFEIPISYGLE